MKRLALLAVFAAAPSLAADRFLTSSTFTLRFGVETDFANSARIDNEHVDLDYDYNAGGRFDMLANVGGSPALIDSIHFYANANTRFTAASIPANFAFLGATANQPFWVLPQNQISGRLYLGLNSDQIDTAARNELSTWNPGDSRNNANTPDKYVELRLVDVRGPDGGHFSLYQTGAGGSVTVYMSSFDNDITDADAIFLRTFGHQHFNWAFTQPGLYEIDVQLRTFTSVDLIDGDFDRDRDVDFADLLTIARHFGGDRGFGWDDGDNNADGAVDFADLLAVARNYGVGTLLSDDEIRADLGWAFSVIPEPAGLAGLIGCASLCLRRTVRRGNS